jgi:hypothetical protein
MVLLLAEGRTDGYYTKLDECSYWVTASKSDALVTHTNPMTGETFTAPSGGYTPNYNMLTSNPSGNMFRGAPSSGYVEAAPLVG